MAVSITQRKLTESEISSLMQDGKLFPHVAYVNRSRWQSFSCPYIVEVDGIFAGICAIYYFDKWVKLGPLEVLKLYHGKGIGRVLLQKIVDNNKALNIFIASSNPSVKHIIESLDFQTIPNFLSLPKKIKIFLLKKIFEHLSFNFFYEGFRKNFFLLRRDIKYYIKSPKNSKK